MLLDIKNLGLCLLYSPLVLVAASEQKLLLGAGESSASYNQWNLNFSSEAPHYFASVYGLLQQWSNTFFPNGHSIVPCELPPFTKLYHGRTDGDVPPSPEWVSFDIGMAYGIMGGTRHSHMLTYQTTRRTKCIYFDGESATLFGSGQLDTQMLHIWGNLSGPPDTDRHFGLYDEYARAAGLCDWFHTAKLGGPGWGYEGVVRMNAGFEMIWCNFSSPSIRLVSHLNITAPLLPAQPEQKNNERRAAKDQAEYDSTTYFPLPPAPTRSDKSTNPTNAPRPPTMDRNWWEREPFFNSRAWGWYTSAATHYGSSADGPGRGEARPTLNTCGFLSYYSSVYQNQAIGRADEERKALNLTEKGHWTHFGKDSTRLDALKSLTRRRREHALDHVTPSEAATMRAHSERVLKDLLSPSPVNCSGINWLAMTSDIVQTYAGGLFTFSKTLGRYGNLKLSNNTIVRSWMADVREATHSLLFGFLEYPDADADLGIWLRDSSLFKQTYSRCRFQHTRLLDPEEGIVLGPEELNLKWAVEETTGSICSVIIDVGLAVEGVWQSKFNVPAKSNTADLIPTSLQKDVTRWTEGVEELMAWLGWAGEWTGCKDKCGWEESCFIPMWPMIPMHGGRDGPPRYRPGHGSPPYGRPPYGRHGDPYSDDGPQPNRTGSPRRGGFNPWAGAEAELWDPICINSSYFDNR